MISGSRGIDHILIISIAALASIGFVMIASATLDFASLKYSTPFYFVIRHSIYLILGISIAYIISKIKLQFYNDYSKLFLITSFVLCLIVFIPGVGLTTHGATRWLNLKIIANVNFVTSGETTMLPIWAITRERLRRSEQFVNEPPTEKFRQQWKDELDKSFEKAAKRVNKYRAKKKKRVLGHMEQEQLLWCEQKSSLLNDVCWIRISFGLESLGIEHKMHYPETFQHPKPQTATTKQLKELIAELDIPHILYQCGSSLKSKLWKISDLFSIAMMNC